MIDKIQLKLSAYIKSSNHEDVFFGVQSWFYNESNHAERSDVITRMGTAIGWYTANKPQNQKLNLVVEQLYNGELINSRSILIEDL